MAFFKPKPNLPSDEKARIEFLLQRIADYIGFERFLLPVVSADELIRNPMLATNQQAIDFISNHLKHDASELRFEVIPKEAEKCGGGG